MTTPVAKRIARQLMAELKDGMLVKIDIGAISAAVRSDDECPTDYWNIVALEQDVCRAVVALVG